MRWSALTTLTMRSAAPAVEGESAIAVIAAAEARIKQKHRKMFFPLSIKQKTAFGKCLFPMVSFPCEMGRIRAAPCYRSYAFQNVNTPEEWARMTGDLTRITSSSATSIRRSTGRFWSISNFYVDPGETVAIIGRSGVGKSVTLSHIMGFLKPDSGRVIVAHEDITDMAETELRRIRKKVTMVFQSGALFDSLTVAENVLFSLELREDYDEQNKEDVVNGLLQNGGHRRGARRLPRRSFHRLQTGRSHCARAGRAAAMHSLRRAHHHGGPHHVRPPGRPDAASEAATAS